MDYESIKRLGLDHINIDLNESYETFDQTTNNHSIFLKLIKSENHICPYCGVIGDYQLRSTRVLKIKHSSTLENNIIIHFKRRQFRCNACGHHFQEPNPFGEAKKRISIFKDLQILNSLRDINKTYTSIAKDFDVSPSYVIETFDKKVDLPRLPLSEVICVDEVYNKRLSYHHYCFIIYDPINRKIIDVLDSRHVNNLDSYFARIPLKEKQNVHYLSIDLYDNYRKIGKRCFPKAVICADPFHVIKNISNAFHSIRRKVMNNYKHLKQQNDNYYWLFKKKWKILTKDRTKLNYVKVKLTKTSQYMNDFEMIEYMLSIDDNLKLGYELYHKYLVFNSQATLLNAEEWLNEITLEFKNSFIPEYVPVWKMLENWHAEIINSFNRVRGKRVTNGPMERVNRDVKTIFRNSFGSNNFIRMRNRILFSINQNSPILYTRKKKTNKKYFKPRGKYKK